MSSILTKPTKHLIHIYKFDKDSTGQLVYLFIYSNGQTVRPTLSFYWSSGQMINQSIESTIHLISGPRRQQIERFNQ